MTETFTAGELHQCFPKVCLSAAENNTGTNTPNRVSQKLKEGLIPVFDSGMLN